MENKDILAEIIEKKDEEADKNGFDFMHPLAHWPLGCMMPFLACWLFFLSACWAMFTDTKVSHHVWGVQLIMILGIPSLVIVVGMLDAIMLADLIYGGIGVKQFLKGMLLSLRDLLVATLPMWVISGIVLAILHWRDFHH